jgi:hypothetical protein
MYNGLKLSRHFWPLLLLILSVFFASCSGTGESEARRNKILIPLYSYPNWWAEEYTWQNLIEIRERHPDSEIVAIVNPENGHFNEQNSDYVRGIRDLKEAGIRVIGYVYTNYGDRESDEVIQDLDAWRDYYRSEGVEGIFFDETSTDPAKLDYYTLLSGAARSRGFATVVLNPGTTTDSGYIESGIADIVVTYENPAASLLADPPAEYNTPTESTRLALLLYEMRDEDLSYFLDVAEEHDFDYIYFTEDGADGNPWDSVSRTLEDQL